MPSFFDTNDLKKGVKILIDGQPYNVVEAQFVKPGKGAAFTRTKMKNLLTGGVIERNLRSGERMEAADIEEKTMAFLYKEGEDFVFMDQSNYEQINILASLIDDDWRWLKDNMACQVLFFNGRPIGVTLPNFVEMRITYAEPGARGDTSGNVTKPAKVESGADLPVPLFINEGDLVKIDTRTGTYCERLKG